MCMTPDGLAACGLFACAHLRWELNIAEERQRLEKGQGGHESGTDEADRKSGALLGWTLLYLLSPDIHARRRDVSWRARLG